MKSMKLKSKIFFFHLYCSQPFLIKVELCKFIESEYSVGVVLVSKQCSPVVIFYLQ